MATNSSQSLVGGLFQVTNAFRIFAFIYTSFSVPSQPQIGMFHFLQLAATNRIVAAEQRPCNTEGVAVPGRKPFLEPASLPLPSQTPKPLGFAQNPKASP